MGVTATDVDGRRLRREQNREAVLDALVELFHEGVYQPSSNEIAERAGLSPRSLFRYFDDIDDLVHAAIDRQLAAARPLVDLGVGPDAPIRAKVEDLVETRVRLFEAIAPAARAARLCAHRNPIIAAQLHDSRSYLRRQIADQFPGQRIEAVDALCSFETYELLRGDQGLSRSQAVSTLAGALLALIPGG
jgi:AcrR family transcriptional regulator